MIGAARGRALMPRASPGLSGRADHRAAVEGRPALKDLERVVEKGRRSIEVVHETTTLEGFGVWDLSEFLEHYGVPLAETRRYTPHVIDRVLVIDL
jgi:hypothetical protein